MRGLIGGIFLLVLAAVQPAFADQAFLVEAELWLDGVQRGTPSLQLMANSPASIEIGGDDEQGWRLEVEVEPVNDAFAPADTLWVHVAVHQQADGEWARLADSMLGVPEGETATFSIVDDDAAATPESAAVYLRIRTSRVAELP
jgi:hypothetical protein